MTSLTCFHDNRSRSRTAIFTRRLSGAADVAYYIVTERQQQIELVSTSCDAFNIAGRQVRADNELSSNTAQHRLPCFLLSYSGLPGVV